MNATVNDKVLVHYEVNTGKGVVTYHTSSKDFVWTFDGYAFSDLTELAEKLILFGFPEVKEEHDPRD